MAEDWKIRADRARCDKPSCPLPTSKSYFAVLEWPECTRRDLCDACFTDYERRCEGKEAPIFWRAHKKSATSKEPVLDLMSLRVLFDRLAGLDDERARALRYFCALLLIRKRVLRMVRPKGAEQERADLVVEDPKVKKEEREPMLLFAPEIDLDNLGGLKDELLAAIGESDSSGDDEAQSAADR